MFITFNIDLFYFPFMLNAENAQVKPNILTLTAEEEELQRRKREKGAGLMRDRTNRHRNQARNQRRS